ncbi:MAG: tail fiber protein [Rudaea sp.]|nr:tail fiber protein [Rudaea sp.]
MSQPFVGEIRMFGFNFAPQGWHVCDGSLMSISQNNALFALIGTTYGGDGQNTFGLPDFRGRIPIHQGTGLGLSPYVMGQIAGTENVTLLANQIAPHTHALSAATNGTRTKAPGSDYLGSGEADIYNRDATAALASLANATIGGGGSNLPHANMQPVLCVNFSISLFGIFPSRN